MAKKIDARGLLCPEPVVKLKKAIKEGESEITILVSDENQAENIRRVATTSGFQVVEKREGEDFVLTLKKA
jgi:TusA-related sulfurtransferase